MKAERRLRIELSPKLFYVVHSEAEAKGQTIKRYIQDAVMKQVNEDRSKYKLTWLDKCIMQVRQWIKT